MIVYFKDELKKYVLTNPTIPEIMVLYQCIKKI